MGYCVTVPLNLDLRDSILDAATHWVDSRWYVGYCEWRARGKLTLFGTSATSLIKYLGSQQGTKSDFQVEIKLLRSEFFFFFFLIKNRRKKALQVRGQKNKENKNTDFKVSLILILELYFGKSFAQNRTSLYGNSLISSNVKITYKYTPNKRIILSKNIY